MNYIDILLCIVVLFLIVRRVISLKNFKTYEKNAIKVYKNTSIFHKAFRIFCGLTLVYVSYFFITTPVSSEIISKNIGKYILLILSLTYLTFLPNSSEYWILTNKGIYTYIFNRFIPWKDIINTGLQSKKKYSFIVIQTKKLKTDHFFKQTFFRLKINSSQSKEMQELIKRYLKEYNKAFLLHQKTKTKKKKA